MKYQTLQDIVVTQGSFHVIKAGAIFSDGLDSFRLASKLETKPDSFFSCNESPIVVSKEAIEKYTDYFKAIG